MKQYVLAGLLAAKSEANAKDDAKHDPNMPPSAKATA